MDMIYTVTNVSQLGQVGVRSLLLVRLTFEAQSRMKTLWSPSHVHSSLGTLPQKLPKVDQTNLCFPRTSLSSFTPISSILPVYVQNVGKFSSLYLVVYISCSLILGCIKCQWLSGLTRQRVAEKKEETLPSALFAPLLLAHRGSHDLAFPQCGVPFLLLPFNLLPGLYLKTT